MVKRFLKFLLFITAFKSCEPVLAQNNYGTIRARDIKFDETLRSDGQQRLSVNIPYIQDSLGGGGGSGTVTSVNITAGTGISASGGPVTTSGSITVTNTAPDVTVVLNEGTGAVVSNTALFSAFAIGTGITYKNISGLSLAVTKGYSLQIKIVIGSGGTNPANIRVVGTYALQ